VADIRLARGMPPDLEPQSPPLAFLPEHEFHQEIGGPPSASGTGVPAGPGVIPGPFRGETANRRSRSWLSRGGVVREHPVELLGDLGIGPGAFRRSTTRWTFPGPPRAGPGTRSSMTARSSTTPSNKNTRFRAVEPQLGVSQPRNPGGGAPPDVGGGEDPGNGIPLSGESTCKQPRRASSTWCTA
jgi:hypothetical protein